MNIEASKPAAKEQSWLSSKLSSFGFTPLDILMRSFFVYATILTVRPLLRPSSNLYWEDVCQIWVWNYVDVTAIIENIYRLTMFSLNLTPGESRLHCYASNIPGVLVCTFMIFATTDSITDQGDDVKLMTSNLSFAAAMFGSMSPAFVNLLYSLCDSKKTFKEKLWEKGTSFSKQDLYVTIEWFLAGFGSIGNSLGIIWLVWAGYFVSAVMKAISLVKLTWDNLAFGLESDKKGQIRSQDDTGVTNDLSEGLMDGSKVKVGQGSE
jgi:hypothetical protein